VVFQKEQVVRFYDRCAAERSLASSAAATGDLNWNCKKSLLY